MNSYCNLEEIITTFEEFIFNSILIQFLFNNITIINIIIKIITYNFTNLFTMLLGYFYNIINTCYNKYRFDKLEKTVYKKFQENFENINKNNNEIKEKIDRFNDNIQNLQLGENEIFEYHLKNLENKNENLKISLEEQAKNTMRLNEKLDKFKDDIDNKFNLILEKLNKN